MEGNGGRYLSKHGVDLAESFLDVLFARWFLPVCTPDARCSRISEVDNVASTRGWSMQTTTSIRVVFTHSSSASVGLVGCFLDQKLGRGIDWGRITLVR